MKVAVLQWFNPVRWYQWLTHATLSDWKSNGLRLLALLLALLAGAMILAFAVRFFAIAQGALDSAFGRTEPDEEIQELLRKSEGLNLGVHYLSGAITYDPAVNQPDPLTAAKIVWLDAFLMNVDRTARNTNMLNWKKELWLIDHGASLIFHHAGGDWEEQSKKAFSLIKDHVLLPFSGDLDAVSTAFQGILTPDLINSVTALIPADWLAENAFDASAEEMRQVYNRFLISRTAASAIFVNEAKNAREAII